MGKVPYYLRVIRDYDYDTYLHCNRVAEFAFHIGQKIALSSPELDQLVNAARLHDLGKVKIDKKILYKPGKLNQQEWDEICRHSLYGSEMLSQEEEFEPIVEAIYSHHEHFNGLGYPRGLKGESINIYARVISIADAFDAMTTDRVYRSRSLTPVQAIQEIRQCSVTQFDPNITKVLTRIDPGVLSFANQLKVL